MIELNEMEWMRLRLDATADAIGCLIGVLTDAQHDQLALRAKDLMEQHRAQRKLDTYEGPSAMSQRIAHTIGILGCGEQDDYPTAP